MSYRNVAIVSLLLVNFPEGATKRNKKGIDSSSCGFAGYFIFGTRANRRVTGGGQSQGELGRIGSDFIRLDTTNQTLPRRIPESRSTADSRDITSCLPAPSGLSGLRPPGRPSLCQLAVPSQHDSSGITSSGS